MFKYKTLSVQQFKHLPEIRGIEDKNKFSQMVNPNGVVNFMQLMFDYMGRDGWEYVGVSTVSAKSVDFYADAATAGPSLTSALGNLAKALPKTTLTSIARDALGGQPEQNSYQSNVDVYIFRMALDRYVEMTKSTSPFDEMHSFNKK